MIFTNQISSAKKYFNILQCVSFVTYKEWAAYRTHAVVSVFVGPVYYLAQVFIWTSLYAGNNSGIAGMTLESMLAYFGVSAVIGYLTMDFADWNFQMLVQTGKFTTFLLRPVHHRFFALSQKVGHRFLGFWFEFLPVYLIFLFVFKVKIFPANLIWAVLSLIFAYLTVFYINYCIGLSAFWLTKTGGLRSLFSFLVFAFSGALVPLTLFPAAMQKVLFILPFQFITYVPVRVFLGSYNLAGVTLSIPETVALQGCVVAVCALLSELLYKTGIRRFTGVGT